jgi:hypothetical protein
MPDASTEFFTALSEHAQQPVLGNMSGSVRFDLHARGKTAHWFVDVRRGAVTVSQEDRPADCVIHADRAQFDEVASGRLNAMAAALRGMFSIEGNPGLLVRFQRLFPAGEGPHIGTSARTVGRQRS